MPSLTGLGLLLMACGPRAVRVTDAGLRDALFTAAGLKYEQIAERDREQLDGVWVFRIDPPG